MNLANNLSATHPALEKIFLVVALLATAFIFWLAYKTDKKIEGRKKSPSPNDMSGVEDPMFFSDPTNGGRFHPPVDHLTDADDDWHPHFSR